MYRPAASLAARWCRLRRSKHKHTTNVLGTITDRGTIPEQRTKAAGSSWDFLLVEQRASKTNTVSVLTLLSLSGPHSAIRTTHGPLWLRGMMHTSKNMQTALVQVTWAGFLVNFVNQNIKEASLPRTRKDASVSSSIFFRRKSCWDHANIEFHVRNLLHRVCMYVCSAHPNGCKFVPTELPRRSGFVSVCFLRDSS